MLHGAAACWPRLSVATRRNCEIPATLGIPLTVPSELKLRPVGSVPNTFHLYAPLPPVAATFFEYGWPVVAGGSGQALDTVSSGNNTTTPQPSWLVWPPESVTRTVNGHHWGTVGIPLRMPLEVKPIPAGRPPVELHR